MLPIKKQDPLEEIEQEYFRRRDNYFEKRKEFFEAKRKMTYEISSIEIVIELSEEYGFTKALYADYKNRYNYLMTQNN